MNLFLTLITCVEIIILFRFFRWLNQKRVVACRAEVQRLQRNIDAGVYAPEVEVLHRRTVGQLLYKIAVLDRAAPRIRGMGTPR
jgi:hypothetical protein